MAALTAARRLALFQVLEVPMFPQQSTVYPDGSVARLHDLTGSRWEIGTLIDAHLSAYIYVDTNIQTTLENLLDGWINLGTDTSRIEAGSVGNVTGINDDTMHEREEIRRQVLVLVPFFRFHEQMQRATSSCIEIIR